MDNNPHENQSTPTPNPTPVPTPVPTPAPVAAEAAPETPKGGETFEFNKTTILASLSYVGPLVVVPYLTEKENPFIMFHIKQGLVVLILDVALWVAGWFLGFLWPLLQVVNYGLLILSIIGIVYALQRKEKELPLVGSFASHIKL